MNFRANIKALEEAIEDVADEFGIASSDIVEVLNEPRVRERDLLINLLALRERV